MRPLARHVMPSVTMQLDQEARILEEKGKDIINLTAGQVDLPISDDAKNAVMDALKANRTGYVPATGSREVKKAVRIRMGWDEGEIIISAGAKPLLSAAVSCICNEGDEVIIAAPCYTSYPEMVRLANGNPVIILGSSEKDFILTKEDIEKVITSRTKAVILNNPVNPTGAVYRKDNLREIADVCEKHDLYLIADEVYSSFVYEEEFISLYEFRDIRKRLILINSASKTYAMAGLRLGYAVADHDIAFAMGAYLSHMLGCPCSLSEQAVLYALQHDMDRDISFCSIFRDRRESIIKYLSDIEMISIKKNAGAFYLWIDVSHMEDDISFCRKLLAREGVALTPGSAFCCPGYVRLAYTKDTKLLREAATRIRRFIDSVYSSISGDKC